MEIEAPARNTPPKAAESLAQQQWKCQRELLPPRKNSPKSLTSPNHVVKSAIAKQRSNKTLGPDRLRSELIKYLDANNRQTLLDQINHMHHTGELEPALHDAQVVSVSRREARVNLRTIGPFHSYSLSTYSLLLSSSNAWRRDSMNGFAARNMSLETEEVPVMRFSWHVDVHYRISRKTTVTILLPFYWIGKKVSTKSTTNVH